MGRGDRVRDLSCYRHTRGGDSAGCGSGSVRCSATPYRLTVYSGFDHGMRRVSGAATLHHRDRPRRLCRNGIPNVTLHCQQRCHLYACNCVVLGGIDTQPFRLRRPGAIPVTRYQGIDSWFGGTVVSLSWRPPSSPTSRLLLFSPFREALGWFFL
jgi:hypothetical protein